jgi:hypothetical protein
MIPVTRNPMERSQGHRQQKGIVLVVGLVMLISLTLIGVTAMKSTTIDERISANTQFKAIAFQVAESALSDAASWDGAVDCYLKGEDVCDNMNAKLTGAADPAKEYIKSYATGAGDVEGRGEMRYLGERMLAGYSIGGPISTPVVKITGCASDAANKCLALNLNPNPEPKYTPNPDAKLGNTNAKASHNMGVALVGIKP